MHQANKKPVAVCDRKIVIRLVVFLHPSEKYAQVKLDHFPNFWGENKNYLKPPPSDISK